MDYVRRCSAAPSAGYVLCAALAVLAAGCGGDSGGSLSSGTPAPGAPQGVTVPSITGTPATTVVAGSPYSFHPSASDTKSDALTFSIENMPSWATFDKTTGALSGTPSTSNVGYFQSITISVSNGEAVAQLASFSIEVTAPPTSPPSPSNSPPTIAGTPAMSVQVGSRFGFKPSAADADKDSLVFTISGQPSWTSFDTSTGQLSGTPSNSNVGTYSNIVISVSDGKATVSLAAFNITVTAIPTSAVPTVDGVSGVVSQGSTLTITGSGFGTKPTAPPYFFSDFDTASVGQTALQAGLDDEGTDGQGLPMVTNDKAFSGKQSLRMNYVQNKDSMFPRIGKGGLNSSEVYVSVWTYWTHTAGSGGSAFIFKLVRGGANPSYSGVPRFYETIRPNLAGIVLGSDRGSVNSSNATTFADDVNAGQNADGWHRSEYYFKISDPGVANGQFQSWVDGVLNANVSNTMSQLPGTSAAINYVMSPFDGIDSYGLSNSYELWADDFYIDTTRARVEIGDASTLSACKKRSILPPQSWSDSQVLVRANVSMFASGSNAFIYVFDSNGNVNSTGYPVTVGSSGGS